MDEFSDWRAISRAKAAAVGSPFTLCNCVGPQLGQPVCPCQMRNVIIRDGRYIRVEQDLGPAPAKKGIDHAN
jgi:hypothetical protein